MTNSTSLREIWDSQINEEIEFLIYRNYYSSVRGNDITSINKMYLSPFTDEKTPSFHLFRHKGRLLFKCFSTDKSGSVIDFVKTLTGESYGRVLKTLVNSYMLKFEPQTLNITWKPLPVTDQKDYIDIVPVEGEFTQLHVDFLAKYGIMYDTLKEYDGFPIRSYKIITYGDIAGITISSVRTVSTKFAFAFRYKNKGVHYPKCKIYAPGQEPKMFGNTTKEDIFEKSTVKMDFWTTTLIAAGQKDTMILSQLVPEDVIVIAANSENVILNITDAFVLLDNDDAGRRASANYTNISCNIITLPFWGEVKRYCQHNQILRTPKDIGDMYHELSIFPAEALIISTLNKFIR